MTEGAGKDAPFPVREFTVRASEGLGCRRTQPVLGKRESPDADMMRSDSPPPEPTPPPVQREENDPLSRLPLFVKQTLELAGRKERADVVFLSPGGAFDLDLFRECLDEAAFLYTRRTALLERDETRWTEPERLEDRMERFLDVLAIGGSAALSLCIRASRGPDAGLRYAALRVFCLAERLDLVTDALNAQNPGDALAVHTLEQALLHGAPQSWSEELAAPLRRVGARWLRSLAEDVPGDPSEPARSAWMRLHTGSWEAVRDCETGTQRGSPVLGLLGICGGASALSLLRGALEEGRLDAGGVLALGLLGAREAVPLLLPLLGDATRSADAALALHLITGADLQEEAFVPDPVPWGDPPRARRRRAYGDFVVRLAQNRSAWAAWWAEHEVRFASRVRYRLGQPFTLGSVAATLRDDAMPRRARRLAYAELPVRYGLPAPPLRTDGFVSEQCAALQHLAEWLRAHEPEVLPGRWYFAGRAVR